jgi:hypothetical protein
MTKGSTMGAGEKDVDMRDRAPFNQSLCRLFTAVFTLAGESARFGMRLRPHIGGERWARG